MFVSMVIYYITHINTLYLDEKIRRCNVVTRMTHAKLCDRGSVLVKREELASLMTNKLLVITDDSSLMNHH